MQFSENWLRTFINPQLSSNELAHALTMAGLEVEDLDPVCPPFTSVVVAQVKEVSKHPDADRLNVCKIDVGASELLQIVCGAPNVRLGLKVPCALVGAELPPSEDGKPFKIKLGKLRGVESQGMLCSARELKLSDEHSGLLELPEDAPIGQNFKDYYQLNDLKFTIKLTPNRADCLSIHGVAREVAALTGKALKLPDMQAADVTIDEKLPVKIDAPDLCGRFAGRVIRGVNAKAKTPDWMKQRLERSGLRSVSALVDISNYVMLELGRPSHVFDLDKIHGGLVVRWARKGESLKLLNGNTVELDDWVGVIADEKSIESLAGIMGGDATAVTLDTQNIYLESAFWHPQAIQGRARRYNFSTDAAHRYERGVDFDSIAQHMERITTLILEICGVSSVTKVGPIDDIIVNLPKRQPVQLRTARASKIIGIPFTDAQIAHTFNKLSLDFKLENGLFTVIPPSHRFDIEIEEDLIEEIVRLHGFDNVPALPPIAANHMRIKPENSRSIFVLRRQVADLDYQEVVNYSFVDETWEYDFLSNKDPIRLQNPIASQMSVMRTSLIPSLVANTSYNLNRKVNRIRIFEIASVYLKDNQIMDGELSVAGYAQPKRIAALAYGNVYDEQWGEKSRQIDFFDMKSDLEALLGNQKVSYVKTDCPFLHPGRGANIVCEGSVIGVIGELHPRLLQKYDLPNAPVVFELDTRALQTLEIPHYQEVSKFQVVSRDLAFVVKQNTSAQTMLQAFEQAIQKNPECFCIQNFVLFDEYKGKGLELDERSLAFRLSLQSKDATLQDEQVEKAIHQIIEAAKNIGARLR